MEGIGLEGRTDRRSMTGGVEDLKRSKRPHGLLGVIFYLVLLLLLITTINNNNAVSASLVHSRNLIYDI